MERKLLLVFALTFLVIMLFQPLMKKYGPQPPAKTESAQQAPTQNQPQPATAAASNLTSPAVATASAKLETGLTQQSSSELETTIENDVYRIVFTNRGGRVKSWVLKKYTDDKGGQLELVNTGAAEKYGYPLTLWSFDEALRDKLNSALYVVSARGDSTDQSLPSPLPAGYKLTAPSTIVFKYGDGGISVEKTFTFDRSSYVVGVHTAVYQKGAQVTAFPMWPAGFGADMSGAQYSIGQVVYQYDDKVERLAIKKISGGGTVQGPLHWAGISDQYFAAVFVPMDPKNAAMVTLRNAIEIPHSLSDKDDKRIDKVDVLGAAVGSLRGPSDTRLYVGPKALSDLESVPVPGITGAEPDLRAIIDFGWLGIIARPLFLWLKWMYTHIVANWGWAILLQTLVINLALLPLRLSQMKSMLKMQRVAPQIKAIQEKYKKYSLRDPKKAEMNEEISALYKQEGVNPVGGCLPLLIQMPFLFAYYRMLNVAMDLRHAPWLWVHDLSSPDPRYILPITIVITMFFMQRMTPQAGMDPAQQKMMNFMMPAMLGYMSFTLPAGLSLYWAMGQVIGIVQQAALNRSSLGREMREMMAKRARKKDK
ncbi:MAG TPA: membrane protein insertase YidC [Terriglobales bacterium]|nr:membrane protein insertase YidC [Terriglobales bacterium]